MDYLSEGRERDRNRVESFMSVKEFCERMEVSTSTVYRMIKAGQLPAVKFGRRWKISWSVFDKINPRFL